MPYGLISGSEHRTLLCGVIRYLGKGVLKAVENINALIAPALKVRHEQLAQTWQPGALPTAVVAQSAVASRLGLPKC